MTSKHDQTSPRLAGDFKPRLARRLAATVFALAISISAAAAPQMTTIEECVESGTDLVSLPGTAGGSLSASQCSGCPSVRLSFSSKTRYYIGNEAVSYARLREAASKGDLRLDLFYEPKTRNLTRVRLAAAVNAK